VAATAGVVVLPILLVLVLAYIGLPDPQVLVAALACAVISIAIAAIGASMWVRRKESVDVAFGELMLWRFLRRHKAERTIDRSADQLGLGTSWEMQDRVIHLEPDRALDVLHRLTTALEAKDPYTHGHSRRVERHVHRTAMAMGLSTEEIKELRTAAALHDVGKIRIPSRILRKPDSLNHYEESIVREHVHVGAAMVATAASSDVTDAIRSHHERWDGSGYPEGLSQTSIPLYARIIAVADTYDALISARPYKAGVGRRRAIEVLREGAGVHFDPQVVDAFISTLPAALPAVSALLVFVTPERAARRIMSWAHSSAVGSVSTGAIAAGTAAAVITAGAFMGPNLGGSTAQAQQPQRGSQDGVELVQSSAGGDSTVKVEHRSAERGVKQEAHAPAGEEVNGRPATSQRSNGANTQTSAADPSDGQSHGPKGDNNAGGNDNEGSSDNTGAAEDPGDNNGNGDGDRDGNDNDDAGEDDNGDEDDGAGDEDCDEKKGKGHEEHGQGEGTGHAHHCGE
jgi:HD-GYP domain-containing protein (c-di-GMP phosphodiesterase class II)